MQTGITGSSVRSMFNLILKIKQRIVTSQSHSGMTQMPAAKQKETGTEVTEVHKEKKVGYLWGQEAGSGAAIARKKGWPPRKASKVCDNDRSELRQAVRINGVLQEVTFTKNAV